LQDKIVRNKIDENTKQRISSTAGRISEGLQIYQFPEWRMEKIDCSDNEVSYIFYQLFHYDRSR
jgi:hypothetical protein